MKIDILTIFPELFASFIDNGIVFRAREKKLLEINLHNIRSFTTDKHHQVDDYPFGGGAGMVMKPEPLYEAITSVLGEDKAPVVYFTPQGRLLNQDIISRYKDKERIIFLCGHYKEIDQRIRDMLVTDEISIGDYVLSGGEVPAMVMIDAVSRLIDGVIGDIESAMTDSHQRGLLGTPHYTRPAKFMDREVPDVLISGNHAEIDKWRQMKARELTMTRRPDLYYGKS
ncbi:MAG: tRNA (guanosine(37)-N1)-methyltransferase TrmD [Candidatus Cloacimonetes bacterium]|nr:tRNA (guanosine(37)-N1)-methyltransferase TrmD [Candidatus Cloacimonadota bacterium]